jgi:hypothetical protein
MLENVEMRPALQRERERWGGMGGCYQRRERKTTEALNVCILATRNYKATKNPVGV